MLRMFCRFSIGILCLLSVIFSTSVVQAGTRIYFEGYGSVFVLVNEPETWEDAHHIATNAFGILARPSNSGENNLIYTNALNHGTLTMAPDGGNINYLWLGGSDSIVEGSWRWGNSILFNTGYSNWVVGCSTTEPNQIDPSHDYLGMGLGGWPSGFPGAAGYASQRLSVPLHN